MRTVGIVVVPPWREAEHLENLPTLCEQAGFTDLGFMIQCHPESVPLRAKIEESVARFVKASDIVRDHGIRAGILLQTTVGHGDRFRPVSPVTFQRIIGEDGAECVGSFCPVDEDFDSYMADTVTALAESKPDFLLVDDDFRLSHHAPAAYGCFCDTHLQMFNSRFGENLERSNLVRLMADDGERAVRARSVWLEVRKESYLSFCRMVRARIDAVDPEIACGFCNVMWNTDLTTEVSKVLAGDTRPFARLNAGVYLNSTAAKFASSMVQTANIRAWLPAEIECLSEADTCPHTRYSMSAAATKAYIVGTLLSGVDGAKLWIANCQEWYIDETDRHRRTIGTAQPMFEEIRKLVSELDWMGPYSPQLYSRNPELSWKPEEEMWNRESTAPNWASIALGRYGMPWQVTDEESPVLIAGDTAASFSSARIEEFLSRSALIDGRAAAILGKRGFESLLGVRIETSQQLRVNFERFSNDTEIYGRYASTSLSAGMRDLPKIVPVSEDVRIISSFMAVPYYQSTDETFVAPAVTLYKNEAGGRIAVFSRIPGGGILGASSDRIKAQLIGVLRWIGTESIPVWTVDTADALLRFGRISSHEYLLAVINLSADRISPLALECPELGVKSVRRLSDDGAWTEAAFRQRGSRIEIDCDLSIFDSCIARVDVISSHE